MTALPTENGSARLNGRVAVITGAGAGLGRACAFRFAAEGARVVVADINTDRARAAAQAVIAAGGDAIAVGCDVSVEAEVCNLVDQAVSRFDTVDIMLNNAGIPLIGAFEDITVEQFRRVVDVNLFGAFLGCKAVVPLMKAKRSGVILNTSSAAALVSVPFNSGYAATKGAINALTRDLSVELGPFNVRVNALCSLGGMSANMTLPPDAPLVDEDAQDASWNPADSLYVLAGPRPPKLADHAAAALFLVSDEASWVSGVCLPVDGATSNKAAIDVSRKLASYAAAAT